MRNPEMGGMPPAPEEEKPHYVVGAEKKPDGTIDYSRAAVMEQPVRTFFGSEKGAQIKAMAEQMSREDDPLAGYMLNKVIDLAIFESEMDRSAVEQKVLSEFNFDGHTGEPLAEEDKNAAVVKAMEYFDELQEIRDAVLEQEQKSRGK